MFSDLGRCFNKATYDKQQCKMELMSLTPELLCAAKNAGFPTDTVNNLLCQQVHLQEDWLESRDIDQTFKVRYLYMKVFTAVKAE